MSVKISQLSASSDITSDDFFPVVDSGSLTTKRASAQQMLDYVTGSTFDTLTVTTLDGTTAQFTTITGSISAPTGTFTMLSGSSGNITISGSLSGMIAALTSSVTDYVLVAADSGKVVVLSSSSGITASIPTGLPIGFTTTIVQNGSGSIFVSASSGVVIRNRQNHTRTAGLYATVAIIGTGSNSYIFAGDTTS
jgi:hypothetical protein